MNKNLPHTEIINRLFESIKNLFPDLGLAVTGSVATNTHTLKSDIDLLIVSENYDRTLQLEFIEQDVRVNIMCMNSHILQNRYYKNWLFAYSPIMVNYILFASVMHDPKNLIADMKSKLQELVSKKQTYKFILTENLSKEFFKQYQKINQTTSCWEKRKLYQIMVEMLLKWWFIKSGVYFYEKKEYKNLFLSIKKNDSEFYNLMAKYLPFQVKNIDGLLEVANYLKKG